MSARYLLDTNIVSDLVRHPQGRAAAKIAEVGEDAVATSIIVAAELRYGAAKKASPRLTAQLEAVLGVLEIIALEVPADASYGAARVALEAAGTPIGANDLLVSLGKAGQFDDRIVVEAMNRAIAATAPHGGFAGCGGNRDVPRQAASIKRGVRFLTTQTDIGFLTAAASQWTAGLQAALKA